MPKYRGCFVPSCRNTLLNSPKKTFVNVPKVKEIRELWFRAVGRETRETSSTYLACEDHFNFENDMDNYMEFRLTGAMIRMKKTALPHLMLGDDKSEASQKMQVCLVNKITDSDQIDYNQACRCCLLKSDDMKSFYDLYTTDMRVSEVFKSTTSLEFSSDQDSLPTQMCHVCFCELNLSYKFVLKCRESDKKLRKYLNSNKKSTLPINSSLRTQNTFSSNLHTSISFAHVDIKSELDDFDPLSDHLLVSAKKIKLDSHINNLKSNDATVANNFECVNVIAPTSINDSDIFKYDDLNTKTDDLNFATPIYELQSDEIFKQLQQSNRHELDLTAGTSNSRHINATIDNKVIIESEIRKDYYQDSETNMVDADELAYACTICDKSFKRTIGLSDHLKTHIGGKLYACTLCDKTFNQLSVKNIHMRTHTGAMYSCTVCDKTFHRKELISRHMLTHAEKTLLSYIILKTRMRKYCFVPSCLTTSGNARGKIFITIPKPDEIRKRWLRAVGREDCTTKKLFFCQDHFDFENDMENFREYSIMGGRIYMKKDAVPHLMLGDNNGSPNIVMVEPDTLVLNGNQLESSIDPLFLPIPLTSTVGNNNVFPNSNTVGTSSRSSSEITLRKYCFVPSCTNSTVNARHKLFVTLPRPEEIRKRWLQAVGREQSSPKGSVYFCQDHFNLENDMQNYREHSLMGGRIFMKKNVVPHLMLEASNDNIQNPDIIMIEPETLMSIDSQHDSSMEAIDPLLLSGPSSPPISVQQEPAVTNKDEFSNKNNSTTKRITTLTNSTSSTTKKSAPSKIHLTNNVSQPERIDMNKTCRSCLLNTGNMISLKEPYLTDMSVAEVITSTTSIEISCDLDGLPTQICHDCFCKLHLSYKFVLKFRQSDNKLRTFLNKFTKTKHVKNKPNPQNASTQTDSIRFANDVKLERYDLDSLSDHINSEQTNLEYANNNSKAFHTIFEHNYGRTIDVNPISVNGLECDVVIKTENMSFGNEELSKGIPVHQSPSDEMLGVNQLEGSNEICNKMDQDGPAQMEEGCSNRKGLNHMGIRECHLTEATNNNKDDHFKLGSKSFKFCSLQKRHKIHVKTPANEPVKRRFPCAVCDVSFDQMGQLKCHRRIHKADRSYACTYCDRTFKYRASLKRHTQTHTGEKPYSCSVCRKTFAQRISLTYHMLKHTGEKSYACTVCTKRFTRKAGLTYHMRLHTGEKPYPCTLCDRSFSHRTSWVSHKKSHNR